MKGKNARQKTTNTWKVRQQVFWNGEVIDRNGEAFQGLVRRAYRAMFEQNERFRDALLLTRGKQLRHSLGSRNPHETILTEQEFCRMLTELRDGADMAHNNEATLVCFRKRCPFRVFCK